MVDKTIGDLTEKPSLADGDLFEIEDGVTGNSRKVKAERIGAAVGASFPGSPVSGDRFYRTDRNIEYFYDGTRWLSVQIFTFAFDAEQVTASFAYYNPVPYLGTYSLYLMDWNASMYRGLAGEWDLALRYRDSLNAVTTLDTFDGAGLPSATWQTYSAALGFVLSADALALDIAVLEISGSSNCIGVAALNYRLVG